MNFKELKKELLKNNKTKDEYIVRLELEIKARIGNNAIIEEIVDDNTYLTALKQFESLLNMVEKYEEERFGGDFND